MKSEFFVRATGPDIREMLSRVSAANVSDALHRSGDIPGMRPLAPGAKMVGPALTVRTAPGDWAKPVEAIDKAQPGRRIGHRRRRRAAGHLGRAGHQLGHPERSGRRGHLRGGPRHRATSGRWASPSSPPW